MNVSKITDDDLRKIANCAVPTVAEVCALADAELSRRAAKVENAIDAERAASLIEAKIVHGRPDGSFSDGYNRSIVDSVGVVLGMAGIPPYAKVDDRNKLISAEEYKLKFDLAEQKRINAVKRYEKAEEQCDKAIECLRKYKDALALEGGTLVNGFIKWRPRENVLPAGMAVLPETEAKLEKVEPVVTPIQMVSDSGYIHDWTPYCIKHGCEPYEAAKPKPASVTITNPCGHGCNKVGIDCDNCADKPVRGNPNDAEVKRFADNEARRVFGMPPLPQTAGEVAVAIPTLADVPIGAVAVIRTAKAVWDSLVVAKSAGYTFVGNSIKWPDNRIVERWYWPQPAVKREGK